MSTDDIEYKQKQDKINEFRDQIEHEFDSVVILVSWRNEHGQTSAVQSTAGNWYAQNGLASEFLKRRDEDTRLEVRHKESE